MISPLDETFSPKDLNLLGRCLDRLDDMLQRAEKEPEDEAVRDSVIKRFELAYELAHRTLIKLLVARAPSAERITGYDFQDLIRKGDQQRLLRTGWPEWKRFREARNRTVHTYREEIAIEVAADAREFALEGRALFNNLSQRMQADA